MRDFVTGATGFIGSALVVELLERHPDRDVVCLSRGSRFRGARERAFAQLEAAVEAYDSGLTRDELAERVTVVEGDLVRLPSLPADVDRVWHTAASLKFDDTDRAEIEETNVAALRRIVDWLGAHPGVQLNHFSTAYVAGQREGDVTEDDRYDGHPTNNYYEQSKRDGEAVVRGSGLPWRILRPSIVIGHSRTRRTLSQSGMYGFCGKLRAFRNQVAETFGDLFSNIPMNLLSHPDKAVDLVPVDRVVRAAVGVGTGGRDLGTVTHLTNSRRPLLRDMLDTLFEVYGMLPPNYVTEDGQLSAMDRAFSESIDFYAPYIRQEKRFRQADPWVSEITDAPLSRAEVRLLVEQFHRGHLWRPDPRRTEKEGALHV